MESREIRARKHSSTDGLIRVNHETFGLVKDRRSGSVIIPIVDALMSAFSMFSRKCPSLLAFEDERNHPNLRRIYRIERAPSDTRMREILDGTGGEVPLVLAIARGRIFDSSRGSPIHCAIVPLKTEN